MVNIKRVRVLNFQSVNNFLRHHILMIKNHRQINFQMFVYDSFWRGSSVGQSSGIIIHWSGVRIPPSLPKTISGNRNIVMPKWC